MPTVFLLLLEGALGYALFYSFQGDAEAAADSKPASALKWLFRLLLIVAMAVTLYDCFGRLSAACA